MLSDAGGGLARQRREICFLSRPFYNLSRNLLLFLLCYNFFLLTPSFHGDSMHLFNNNKGFPAKPFFLTRIASWPATMVKEEYNMSSCSPTVKSENCVSNISRSMESRTLAILVVQWLYRIPSKSNLYSPCSSTDWSYVLTPEPVMILAAEGLDLLLPSSSQIDLYPYNGGCVLSFSPPAENLEFSLLGPLLKIWPITRSCGFNSYFARPRSVFLYLLLSPIHMLYRSLKLCGRRLHERWRSASMNWRCSHHLRTLIMPANPSPDLKQSTITIISTGRTKFLQIIYASANGGINRMIRASKLLIDLTLKELRDEVVVLLPSLNSTPTINYETLLASRPFRPSTPFQTPRSFLSILLLPIRHCLGSLVDLDVRRLHLRIQLPRMFGNYIGCARIMVNAPFVTLFATSYHLKKQVCLNPLLVPYASTCQLLPQGRRLGSDLNSQGQPDYKLCVEFLNLHGQWLHVREDPPALLRLVTHQMRFPVSSSSKVTSTWQPSNPLASSVEHTFKSSYASIVRAKYDHLLVRDFLKLVFKLESYKTSKDLPSLASSSRLCIFLENSWSLYLSISCNLLLLSCKNTPLLRF